MPMLVMIDSTNITEMLVRIFLNQYNCGEKTLQEYIVQAAHAYGPKARLRKVNRS